MSVGIIFIRITKDVTPLFLSNNVPSLLETRVFMEFTAYTAARYYLDVLIVKNNRGPLLSEFYGRQHVQIANDLLHNVTVFRRGETYTLADLCQLATCWSGMEFINDFHQSFNNPDTKVSPNLKFDFPVAEAFGTKIPLWSILGNVTTDRRHSVQQAHLLRVVTSVTIKSGANHVSSLELYEILRSFGLQFEQHFHQQKYSDLELYTYYNDAIEPATTELSLAIIPKLTISLVLLGLFTVVSCMSRSYRSSKGLESIAGILNTFMAYGSAVGLISIFGGRDCSWNSSLCVTPFLVLAIGVDDMFVLISSWNRTNPTHSVPKRMGDLMADGSVSILITSLTNVISFAVGISQSTPAVKAFSIYTSVALSLEFFYQMTFFMGVMAYGGYREKDQMKRFPLQLCHKKYKVSRVSAEKLYDTNSSEEGVKKKFPRHPCKRLLLKLLSWRIGRITIVALFTGLLVVSVYGCTCIQVNFAPRKLVLSDSNFERYYDLADKTVFKDSLVAYVTVNRPPNISDPEELRNFYEFVKAIEQIPHAVGAQSTELWLNDYLIYLAKMPPRQDSLSHLLGWLEFRENSRWKDVIVYRNNSDGRQMELVSFQFVTLYSDLGQFYQKNRWLSVLRDTYLQYSQFNVSVYTDFSYYADQVRP